MLQEVASWWTTQMATFVPPRWRPAAGHRGTVFASVGTTDPATISLTLGRRRAYASLGSFPVERMGLPDVMKRRRPRRVVLRVPHGTLLERSVALPMAA